MGLILWCFFISCLGSILVVGGQVLGFIERGRQTDFLSVCGAIVIAGIFGAVVFLGEYCGIHAALQKETVYEDSPVVRYASLAVTIAPPLMGWYFFG